MAISLLVKERDEMDTENAQPVSSESALANAASTALGDTPLIESSKFIWKLLGVMGEIFGKTVSNDLASAYYDALKNEPQDALRQAARIWTRTGKRFPYPADLLELIK